MKFVLISKDEEIIESAQEAYGTHYSLTVYKNWSLALAECKGADLMFVDIVATINEPGKIQGYEDFAAAKLSNETSNPIPLVAIALPTDYEIDSMVGWPGFVIAMWHRPVDAKRFRQASGYV